MKMFLILLAVLSISACSTLGIGSKETRMQNEVACSGFEEWPKCNDKAARMCPNGYDVVKRDESQVQQRRIMTFYCK